MFDKTMEIITTEGERFISTSGVIYGGQIPGEKFFIYLLLFALIAYFIGNVSPSTILARARGLDIKKEGSGNAGTTNALRVMGKKAAVITLAIDIVKGMIAVVIGWIALGYPGAMVCTLCVVIGHVWPVIYRFRGGKGIATSFGALLAFDPLLAVIELLVVALFTLVSRRMSVGSIAGLILLPVAVFFLDVPFFRLSILLSLILLFKHRQNIVRIVKREEPPLGFLSAKKKKNEDNIGSDDVMTEQKQDQNGGGM